MLKKIIFILAVVSISTNVFAQSGTLQGKVVDV